VRCRLANTEYHSSAESNSLARPRSATTVSSSYHARLMASAAGCQAIVSVEKRRTSLKLVLGGHGAEFPVATEGRFANQHWDEELLVLSQV